MARGFAKPAFVSDQAASRLDPSGFNPARGVTRITVRTLAGPVVTELRHPFRNNR